MAKYKVGDTLAHVNMLGWRAIIEQVDTFYHFHWVSPKGSPQRESRNTWTTRAVDREPYVWTLWEPALKIFVRNKLATLGIIIK